jgi:Zn-dependent protease/CBS domain-containing protein
LAPVAGTLSASGVRITPIMRWSFHLARIAGIDVKVHVTFFLLLAFVALSYGQIGGVQAAVQGVAFICAVFLCVVLHEFGHALAARRYGIRTPDITLLPIGGVARLEKMPDDPRQEVVVALAGPLVNVVIALGLWLALGLPSLPDLQTMQLVDSNILSKLLVVNVMLVLFNLIPAFPMDGGRVLRAVLAMRMSYARATQIAANIGQMLAFVGGFLGFLYGHYMLILIAIFIYFGASNEAAFAQFRDISPDLRVAGVMVTQFQPLTHEATLNDAVDVLLSTSQHEFPVLGVTGAFAGLLTRKDLIAGLRRSGPQTFVTAVMRTDIPAVHQSMPFERAFGILQQYGAPALPVLDSDGRLVGLFTPENISELMMVQSALAVAPKRAPVPA